MEVKIFWSDAALAQLEDIYDFYKIKASPSVARKLVKSLIQKSIVLEFEPMVGMKEPLLSEKSNEYRYLIEKNYKIIYRIDVNQIKIVSVFDCRRNPLNINRIID